MRARQRRSFSQQTLETRTEGPLGALLADALTVPEESGYTLTHGFHPYPGRFHPRLARLILEGAGTAGQTVLDPFMGGGTTLVEAMLLGHGAIGADLNPVALLVARERTRPRLKLDARSLNAEAGRIAAVVESLRREKRPPRVRHPHLRLLAPEYAPHLFAELLQWIRLIDEMPAGPERESLRAVFSAGVVKFSNRRADSSEERAPPRYPKGAVSRFLVNKCAELADAQVALLERLSKPLPKVRLLEEDARLLPSLGWACADLALTSPPYPGTYDYHAHHRLRLAWLQLEGGGFLAGEAGPRRDAGESWSGAMRDGFTALARVLRPGADLFLVVGDWMHARHGVDAAAQTLRLAEAKGWRCVSRASARRRPHGPAERTAFAKRGKWEHLLHLRRDGAQP